MTDIYSSVQGILDAQLNSVVAAENLNLSTPLAVFREDAVMNKDNLQRPWIRSFHLPAKSWQQSIGLNGTARYNGIFQIDIYRPKGFGWDAEGTQVLNATAIGDAVIRAFRTGTSLTTSGVTVHITASYRNPSMQDLDSKYYRVSISVDWFSVLDVSQ